jgi:hypothetical protein
MATRTMSTQQKTRGAKLHSRAVERPIEAGNQAMCATCGDAVKFVARARGNQVIANVYEKGVWARVEHYHLDCYLQAGEPYGHAA